MKFFRKKNSSLRKTPFRPNLSIDLNSDKLTEKAEFIYNNTKEYLLNTIETREILQKKTLLILSFIFAFISFSIFHIVDLAEKNSPVWLSTFTMISIIYLIMAILLIINCFYPKDEATSGNEPRNLLIQKNIDQQYAVMLITETMRYQERIDINKKSNKKTVRWVKTTIWGLIIAPIVSLLIPNTEILKNIFLMVQYYFF